MNGTGRTVTSDGNERNTMKSTIITASAGTGKTWTITEELADRIRDGLEPSAIIATTFTTKAAGELAERIRAKLMERSTEPGCADLLEKARSIGSALVGTVNSVSATLVRDFAIDAGLSPELETLTEESAARAFDLACDGVIADVEEAHRDLLRRTGYDRPVDAYEYDDRKSFSGTVRDIAESARQNLIDAGQLRDSGEASAAELIAVLDQIAPEDDLDRRPDWARDGVAACRAAIGHDEGASSAAAAKRRRDFADLAEELSGDVDRLAWGRWAQLGNVTNPKKIAAEFEDFADIAAGIAANPAYRADVRTLTLLVMDAAGRCLDAYDDHKKALGLMDFTDQEVLALRIIRESESARRAIAETYRVLVVDEFQDTNPIQLALFVELGKLVGEVIWVGDPKQSIYGFRGSDPALMSAAIDALADGEPRVLDASWRSWEQPLNLTNELFSATMPGENVRLTVADARAEDHAGGDVRVWVPTTYRGNSNAPWFGAIAAGVTSLLDEGLNPGDIAVLARSKANVESIVDKLTEAGIPCTGDQADLAATREGQIIRAGLGYLLDLRDTQALVELIVLLDDHAAHDTWFADLTAEGTTPESRTELLRAWADDPALAPLKALRAPAVNLTPVECVRQVVDALDLRRRIVGWSRPSRRMASLDSFAALARTYQDETRSSGGATSLSGFLSWVDELADNPVSEGAAGEDAVYVGTMHSAKGLEWKAVCVAVPKPKDRFTPDGHWVDSLAHPTLEDPLGGRRMWFWPAAPAKAALIAETMAAQPVQQERATAGIEDARRLAYVSLTRAAKHSILCSRSGFEDFDAVRGTEVTMTTADEAVVITGADGVAVEVPALVQPMEWTDDTAAAPTASRHRPGMDTLRGPARAGRLAPARVAPSSLTAPEDVRLATAVTERAVLGAPLVSGGGRGWDRVGEAVHGYLGLPLSALDDVHRTAAAERLIDAWGVGEHVTAETLRDVGDRWLEWLGGEYPGAVSRTEVPVTWRNEAQQVHEGWIDQLLELDDGRVVLIDHKTYPGDDPIGHVRDNYIGQLTGYADALELAGKGRPAEILIHLPLKGLVISIRP